MSGATSRCRRSTPITEQVLADFSINDAARMLHYLLKILENMQRLDAAAPDAVEAIEDATE